MSDFRGMMAGNALPPFDPLGLNASTLQVLHRIAAALEQQADSIVRIERLLADAKREARG